MNSFKTTRIPKCAFFIIAFAVFFVLFHSDSPAETKQVKPSAQRQISKKAPASTKPELKRSPDLKVNLKVVKNKSGLVTLNGTILNVGNADFEIPSEARFVMNLSYPPKTYSQIGVSEQLATKELTKLKKGTSLSFNCTYQIPDFDKWIDPMMTPIVKRLFTLSVVKKDMSPFKSGEDCNENNNSKGVEVIYQEKKQ